LTGVLVLLLTVPVALGIVLAKRGRRAALASPQERDSMYRTAFGFAPAEGVGEIGAAPPPRAHRPAVLVASIVPFAASGVFASVSPHHAQQIWVFSCRLFGH
jgi:hypothetical protein